MCVTVHNQTLFDSNTLSCLSVWRWNYICRDGHKWVTWLQTPVHICSLYSVYLKGFLPQKHICHRAVSATVCTASLDQVLDPNYSNVWTSLDRTLWVWKKIRCLTLWGGCLVSCIARADLAETKARGDLSRGVSVPLPTTHKPHQPHQPRTSNSLACYTQAFNRRARGKEGKEGGYINSNGKNLD